MISEKIYKLLGSNYLEDVKLGLEIAYARYSKERFELIFRNFRFNSHNIYLAYKAQFYGKNYLVISSSLDGYGIVCKKSDHYYKKIYSILEEL